MYTMLEKFHLQLTDPTNLTIPFEGMTIFVGPNNSGKSQILKEIERSLKCGHNRTDNRIVTDVDLCIPNECQREKIITEIDQQFPDSENIEHEMFQIGQGITKRFSPKAKVYRSIRSANDKHLFAIYAIGSHIRLLDGRTRFKLTDEQDAGDLDRSPENPFQKLFHHDNLRKLLQDYVHNAFQKYILIDPTRLGKFRLKFASELRADLEQSLNAEARKFYNEAMNIEEMSDGVKAYTGLLISVIASSQMLILLDEPEAFLHPPLVRKLAFQLGEIAKQNARPICAATHSADFVLGAIQSGVPVRIVRLQYRDGISRARMVSPETLETLVRHPLMQSANVISSIFYDGVVITESDNDRTFYQEIYLRLAEEMRDVPAIQFVNAQNKQTIREILKPLREFGVPAAAITDLDIVKDGGQTWSRWLEAAQVPEGLRTVFGQTRSCIKQYLDASGSDWKKSGGIDVLSGDEFRAAFAFFGTLKQYGIFVVTKGELESWLTALGVGGKGTDWTVEVLNRLGSDPGEEQYVRPDEGDVWNFVRGLIDWLRDARFA